MGTKQIIGRVVDNVGTPISGAVVASEWRIEQSTLTSPRAATTDADGRFSINREEANDHTTLPILIGLFAVDREQMRGGSVVVNSAALDHPIDIVTMPLVRVRGQVTTAPHPLPQRTMTLIEPVRGVEQQPTGWVPWHLSCGSQTGSFTVLVPPGSYQIRSYGIEDDQLVTDQSSQTILLAPDVSEWDVGIIQVQRTNLSNLYGHRAPEWTITAAYGVRADSKLADFRGKWVLMEFWTKNCGACIAHGLPELMAFYEQHWNQRNQFVIVALHIDDGSVTDLGSDLQELSGRYWSRKPVPFPVLLVDRFTAMEVYGIRSLPTRLFIDPAGNVTKGLTLTSFAALLQVS
jgi:thiol-disulfide isomerase/thioredoxin